MIEGPLIAVLRTKEGERFEVRETLDRHACGPTYGSYSCALFSVNCADIAWSSICDSGEVYFKEAKDGL